jgi:hypothetical protein
MASQNAISFSGTLVLNPNRILRSLHRLGVFIRSIRPSNHPIGTLFWPQIIVLVWVCSSELYICGMIVERNKPTSSVSRLK